MKNIVFVFCLLISVNAYAISPQFWELNLPQQFAAGDPQSISITSEGELMLAPQLKKIYEGTDSILWKIVADSAGNIYAATGNEGRILKINSSGTASTLLDTDELEVQSMILDRAEVLYAATSPDGKIYQIQKDGKSKVFFDPPEKYIWSLATDEAGNIYAGTGVQGKVYKIDKQGKGTELVDTAESNITALAWTEDNFLLAGSDPNGVLFKIDSTGKAFVLFDADQQQITAICKRPDGEILFSAVSAVRPPPDMRTVPPPPSGGSQQQDSLAFTESTEVVATVESTPMTVTTTPSTSKAGGTSYLYRLNGDGTTESVYISEDQILDIASLKESTLVATGKKAKLIRVEKNKESVLLLRSPEDQITHLLSGKKILVATANPGNIYELVEDHSSKGTYFSDTKDTLTNSVWGQATWKGETPNGGLMSFFTRSGNTRTPDETWSPWQAVVDSKVVSPRARFIQWKVEMTTSDAKTSPVLRSFTLAYLQQNVRPEITGIAVHPPGVVFKRAPMFPQDSFAGLIEQPATDNGQGSDIQQAGMLDPTLSGKREIRRGYQTITWTALDENQDRMQYKILYRPMDSKEWRVLAEDLKETVFAWDTQTIPDGTYQIQVEASDSLSNPKDLSLSGTKESQRFDVDNSAPRIELVKSSRDGGKFILDIRSQDQFSPLMDFQYSLIPGKWNTIFPVDSINDSPIENYRIEIPHESKHSGFIILKSTDRLLNVSTVRFPIGK